MRFLSRLLYSLLMYVLWPIWLVVTLVQACKRGGGRRFITERMGWWRDDSGPNGGQSILWFHAASVGELRSIFPLITGLAIDESLRFVVTSNTPESFRDLERFIEKNNFSKRVAHQYCAIDFYFSVQRMVRHINSNALFVVETELWMNLLFAVKSADKYFGILNGRLSEKTLGANDIVKFFYAQMLKDIDHVAARSAQDAMAFISLGAKESAVEVVGNLKRIMLEKEQATQNRHEALIDTPYVLALSTRDGEEEIIWNAWKQIEAAPLLVIAPRHVRRSAEIESVLHDSGAAVSVRSRSEAISSQTDVYLADTMGEAEMLAVDAQWVFVGGSLVNSGGHNVLEPAQWGKRVVCGPFVDNVQEDVQWLKDLDVLVQVSAVENAAEVFSVLLSEPRDCQVGVRELMFEASSNLLAVYLKACRLALD